MPQTTHSKVSPWIEALILSYELQGEKLGEGRWGRSGDSRGLQAHIIGVGQMSQSQARTSEGPTGLLFLSDDVLQIPAILSAAAWEKLQEQEDRECFTSLLNTTVCIHSFQLQFHMSPQQNRSRFFLSVGELVTTSAGPGRDSPPCCNTLPSVRMKICRTWRTLQGQEDSQRSLCSFDLSQLLSAWQHDCLQRVLKDIREQLVTQSPQPSTSAYRPPLTSGPTGWDVDRVRYKTEECFNIPVKCLLIRGAEPQQSVEDQDGWMSEAAGLRVQDSAEISPLPEDPERQEDRITGLNSQAPSNPWDIFSPPGVTSESSPDVTPPPQSKPDTPGLLTSTQVHTSKDSMSLPPYQKQLITQTAVPSASTSTRPPSLDRSPPTARLQGGQQGAPQHRKRQQSVASPRRAEEVDHSPPSWLFTQSRESEGEWNHSPKRARLRTPPNTHSDGTQFSYSYRAVGQNLQDFSGFIVSESLLHWAVKYLLSPKKKVHHTNRI